MLFLKQLGLFSVTVLFFSATACSHILMTEKLTDWSCPELIEKSKDQKFALSTLAGLRAHKKCENFKYDWRAISSLEKKIYADELLEIDPEIQRPLAEASIDDLRLLLKIEKDPVQKFKIYKQLRQKYKNAGQRDQSISTGLELFKWAEKNWKSLQKSAKNEKKNPDLKAKNNLAKIQYLEAGLIRARTLWSMNDAKPALSLLKTLNANLKTENLTESYFLAAKIHEEQKEYTLAIKNYDLALKSIQKNGPSQIALGSSPIDATKLGWTKSWLLYKTEKWTEAESSLRELSDSTPELAEKTRADFFRSRVLVKLNKPVESKLLLRSIIEKDFYSYYSLASYFLLGEELPAVSKIKKPNVFEFDPKLDFLDASSRNTFNALIKYGELEIAEKTIPYFSKNTDQNANLSIYFANETQRFLPLFSSFAKLSNEAKIDVLSTYPNLIFPTPHESEVKSISKKTELPKSLIYSIMKQESGFNQNTRSHADAYGLMQLIPRLAKTLAKKYEVAYLNPEDLYKPEVNIPLGTFELRDQIKKQNGQLTFVAAAYNAGPNALSGWIKQRRPNEDIFDFIENIPYDETRMYVKIIARNKLFYDRFENPEKTYPFPAEFVNETTLK